MYQNFHVLRECMYNRCTRSSDVLHRQVSCVHTLTNEDTVTLVFINVCTQPAGPPCMPCHSPVFFSRSCRCMHDEHAACVRAWWAARPEAASAGTPLGQDGRPSTRAISGPRRPPGTFDTCLGISASRRSMLAELQTSCSNFSKSGWRGQHRLPYLGRR